MDANNALFHLGLASVSDAALSSGLQFGAIPGSTPSTAPKDGDFTSFWREQAIASYLRAYDLAVPGESKFTNQPLSGIGSLISYEAGQHYASMVQARGPRNQEAETLKAVQATVARIENLPINGVTPIVF